MPQEYDPAGVTRKRYRNLQVKHEKFVRRAAIAGAVAGLVILALNGKNQAQAKKITNLKTETIRLNKDLELAWQNVADNFLAICTILEVVKPSDEQLKEIDAGIRGQIEGRAR